jgi:hypothetical protein
LREILLVLVVLSPLLIVNHIRLDDSDSRGVKDSSAVGSLAGEFYIDFPLFILPRRVFPYSFYGDLHQENQSKAIPRLTEKVSAQASTGN